MFFGIFLEMSTPMVYLMWTVYQRSPGATSTENDQLLFNAPTLSSFRAALRILWFRTERSLCADPKIVSVRATMEVDSRAYLPHIRGRTFCRGSRIKGIETLSFEGWALALCQASRFLRICEVCGKQQLHIPMSFEGVVLWLIQFSRKTGAQAYYVRVFIWWRLDHSL